MEDNTMNVTAGAWPNLRAELLQVGEQPDSALVDRIKSLGADAVPGLIEMAADESLHTADQDDPAVWAPVHAIQILGELEAAEATET